MSAPRPRALTPAEQRRLARRETPAATRLPYVGHLDDLTLQGADGALFQMLHVAGLPFETADAEELSYRKDVRDTMVRGLGGARFALTHHIVRRPAAPRLEGRFPGPFARALDAAWTRRMEGRRLFVNDLFLTIERRPAGGRAGWLDRMMGAAAPVDAAGRARDRRELDAAREALTAALEPYGARPLSVYQGERGAASELLEALALLFDGDHREVAAHVKDAAYAIPARRVSFGVDAIEFSAGAGLPRAFAAILSLKDYPPHTQPGQLDALLRLPHEMVITQTFALADRQSALERIGLVLRRLRAADDDAVSLRRDLTAAKDDLASSRAAFGDHHLTVLLRAESLEALDAAVSETQAAFIEMGAIAVRESTALEPAFWAMFPGNHADVPRKALISSANWAGFASLHNHPIGRAAGNVWGSAVTVLETTAASPYHFNFHVGDLGNFLVIGPSGSGKTVALNFLIAQAERFAPRVAFFDKDRGAEIFLRAMGARYDVLRAGIATGFNPLALPDTPTNRRFLQAWTARLLTIQGETLSVEDLALVAQAVTANFEQAPEYRRLRYFRELFSGARRPMAGDLAARLGPWVGEGDRAWLFDNAEDTLDLSARIVGFDMTQILDDPILRTPAMMYLFHRVEERLDGSPALIIVDEGWKALDDDAFVARIRDWEKTIRKRNGVVGFATQSASDALDSRVASAIIEQSATQIFLPNPKAQARDYCEGFGLSAHEFELVRALPEASRCFLVRQGRESVVARLNLAGLDDLLTVLSGRERTVRLLDELRAEVGDDPTVWLPRLVKGAR